MGRRLVVTVIDLPHFNWPLRFVTHPDGTAGFASVEQDTDEELMASAAVIASTPRGHRDDLPSFGVTHPVFESTPLDAEQLAAEIKQHDGRLSLTAADLADLADPTRRTIRVGAQRATP